MKKNFLVCVIALVVFSIIAAGCTRSATGSPSDVAKAETTVPNPVSTQSQVMKDIIAGTQTAMAKPMDAEPADAEGEGSEKPEDGSAAADKEDEPKPEATQKSLPTSTPGPAPVIELEYNTKTCAPGLYVCIQSYTKDQEVVLQAAYPWLLDDMDITFRMGPDGVYDFSDYIIVGTARYSPTGAGDGFTATLTIPDSLRGTQTIVVVLESDVDDYYGTDYFVNE